MISTTVTVVILCTIYNYINSNCVPSELLDQKVEVCLLEDKE